MLFKFEGVHARKPIFAHEGLKGVVLEYTVQDENLV